MTVINENPSKYTLEVDVEPEIFTLIVRFLPQVCVCYSSGCTHIHMGSIPMSSLSAVSMLAQSVSSDPAWTNRALIPGSPLIAGWQRTGSSLLHCCLTLMAGPHQHCGGGGRAVKRGSCKVCLCVRACVIRWTCGSVCLIAECSAPVVSSISYTDTTQQPACLNQNPDTLYMKPCSVSVSHIHEESVDQPQGNVCFRFLGVFSVCVSQWHVGHSSPIALTAAVNQDTVKEPSWTTKEGSRRVKLPNSAGLTAVTLQQDKIAHNTSASCHLATLPIE